MNYLMHEIETNVYSVSVVTFIDDVGTPRNRLNSWNVSEYMRAMDNKPKHFT